jgi:hypothetical protein
LLAEGRQRLVHLLMRRALRRCYDLAWLLDNPSCLIVDALLAALRLLDNFGILPCITPGSL